MRLFNIIQILLTYYIIGGFYEPLYYPGNSAEYGSRIFTCRPNMNSGNVRTSRVFRSIYITMALVPMVGSSPVCVLVAYHPCVCVCG